MPRVISILSTLVAFGAVLAYALWPNTRPHATETRACADDGRELALQQQVDELEAARNRLETEAKALRALATCGDYDPEPERRSEPELVEAQRRRVVPSMVVTLNRDQRITALRQRNGQLFHELGLSAEQRQRLLSVLAQQEERFAQAFDQPGSQGMDLQRDRNELVQALGQEKAAQFQNLRKTMGARADVRRVRDELEQAGEPLSEEQRQKLVARVTARPSVALEPSPGDRSTAMIRGQERAQQRSEQLRSDMATVLTPAQLELFDQSQELRKAYSAPRSSTGSAVSAARAVAGSAAPAR